MITGETVTGAEDRDGYEPDVVGALPLRMPRLAAVLLAAGDAVAATEAVDVVLDVFMGAPSDW